MTTLAPIHDALLRRASYPTRLPYFRTLALRSSLPHLTRQLPTNIQLAGWTATSLRGCIKPLFVWHRGSLSASVRYSRIGAGMPFGLSQFHLSATPSSVGFPFERYVPFRTGCPTCSSHVSRQWENATVLLFSRVRPATHWMTIGAVNARPADHVSDPISRWRLTILWGWPDP
jgi:hypothetical protein